MRRFGLLISLAVALGVCSFAASVQADLSDPVIRLLYPRHEITPREDLEKIAGGEDALIEKLLNFKPDASTPSYIEMRCLNVLIAYGDRPDVEQRLREYIQSPDTLGAAKLITLHLDKVPNTSSRQRLARHALDRAKGDERFSVIAKHLLQSKDNAVNKMARQSFGR